MELITKPWEERFSDLVSSVNHSILLVSPYITREPLEIVASKLSRSDSIAINILTKFDSVSLSYGSLDVTAIEKFCDEYPQTTVSHLSGLHAKVYVADDHSAIITSGNLTKAALTENFEYGVYVSDRHHVAKISNSLRALKIRSTEISSELMSELEEFSQQFSETCESNQNRLNDEFSKLLSGADNNVKKLLNAAKSNHAIIMELVLHLLQERAMKTGEIYEPVKMLYPDLCDDSDRTKDGREPRWKNRVRAAIDTLKKQGRIEKVDNQNRLTERP